MNERIQGLCGTRSGRRWGGPGLIATVGSVVLSGAVAWGAPATTAPTVASGASTTVPGAPSKPAPPDAAGQAKSQTLIRQIFAADFAKRAPADRIALARLLFKQAQETRDDATARFVLLRESREVATAAGDYTTALQAVDMTAGQWALDAPALRLAVLTAAANMGGVAKDEKEARAFCQAVIHAADDAAAAGDYDSAARTLALGAPIAKVTKDFPFVMKYNTKQDETKRVADESVHVRAAMKRLETNPADAEANLTVGQFRCFIRNDWDGGLPLLAKGLDPLQKTAAIKDLARATDAAGLKTVGEAWQVAAARAMGTPQTKMLERAAQFYARALPNLTDPAQKANVAAQLAQIQKSLPTPPAAAELVSDPVATATATTSPTAVASGSGTPNGIASSASTGTGAAGSASTGASAKPAPAPAAGISAGKTGAAPAGDVKTATAIPTRAQMAEVVADGEWTPLVEGERVFETSANAWGGIPPALVGRSFTRIHSDHQGKSTFTVKGAGYVLMACTRRWGGGGNASGGWKEELTSRAELLQLGWQPLADIEKPEAGWTVFVRMCKAGEAFTYRTEKYSAPLLIR